MRVVQRCRKFIVKIGVGGSKNSKYEIHVNENESYDVFVNNLLQEYPIPNESYFKFICKGKMITADNFDTLNSGSILLALICNKPPINEPLQDTSQKQIVHSQNCKCTCKRSIESSSEQMKAIPNSNVELDQKYSYDEVKGTMIVFLDFVRSNPQIKDMYHNNFAQLVNELIHNPTLQNVMKDILGQSKNILNAIQTGGNISLKLGGDEGDSNEDEITMTPDDGEVINELVNMGFDPNLAIVTYLKNNKDKTATIEALLSS